MSASAGSRGGLKFGPCQGRSKVAAKPRRARHFSGFLPKAGGAQETPPDLRAALVPVAYFVSALDSLRLYAILSRVSTENVEPDGNQDHRGMRRQGGLGRSAADSGTPPTLRRAQDEPQIERAFSRKDAQNSQNANPLLSLSRPAVGSAKADVLFCGNPQSLRAGSRNPQSSHGSTESRPTVRDNPQSAIRNPQFAMPPDS
jgi:hypothetical protein